MFDVRRLVLSLSKGSMFDVLPRMTRLKAFAILLALWAAIYLPGLGSTEIKGEEGRRILPAVTMLDSGNWLVPHVGGRPFSAQAAAGELGHRTFLQNPAPPR